MHETLQTLEPLCMKSPIRTLHIGSWNRGKIHLRTCLASSEFEPTALVDPNPSFLELAREMAELPLAACFTSLELALASNLADAAIISTPAKFHTGIIHSCLNAGLHVFIEKPFTLSLSEARELVKLAENRRLQIIVGQQYRFRPIDRTVRRLLQDGDLGPWGFASLIHHRARPHPGAFLNEEPLLWEMSVHHFDCLRSYFGDACNRISCRTMRPVWSNYPGNTVVSAILEWQEGRQISYLATFDSKEDHFEIRIECANGAIIQSRARIETIRDGARVEHKAVEISGAPLPLPMYDFYQAIHSHFESEVSGQNNLHTLAMMEAASLSARKQGAPVNISSL